MQDNTKTSKLIYPELSYKIMHAVYTVQNKLGSRLQEKYYQRAMEMELAEEGIEFSSQVFVPIQGAKGRYGNYFIDLVVDQKIIVELKVCSFIYRKDINQVLAYLATTNYKLGIIVNFRTPRITYKRIINASAHSL